MWERLSQRDRVILVVIGGVVVCFLIIYFILTPQFQAYGDVKSQLESVEGQLERARIVAGSLKKEKMLARESARYLEEVTPYFPAEMQDGSALVQIGLKAIQNDIDITSFKYSSIVNKDFYLELPAKFTLKGQYRNFISFLRDMENLPNLTEVRNLTVKPLDDSQEGIVEANFDLIVYSDPSPKAQIRLAEMAKWALGRYNAFRPASTISPLPRVVVPVKELTTSGIKDEFVYSADKTTPEVEPELPPLK